MAGLDDVCFDKLAACADKAAERGSNNNAVVVVNKTPNDPVQELKKQIKDLTRAVAAIGKARSRSKSQQTHEVKKQEQISGRSRWNLFP